MKRRPILIQMPPGALPGLPVKVDRLDGLARPIHAPRPHSHGFFTLMYVLSGTGKVCFGQKEVAVGPGSITLTAPGEIHDTEGIRGVDRWGLSFTPDVFGSEGATWLFPTSGQPEWLSVLRRARGSSEPLAVPSAERGWWETQMEGMALEISGKLRGFRDATLAHLKLVLVRAARLATPVDAPEARSPLIDEVFRFIEAEFSTPLSLARIARAVGRSPAHLTTTVREQTGLTVQQWVIERRMAEARRRLLGTDENVLIVAERSGYRDGGLFSRHFKRAHGITPREWRGGSGPNEK